METWISVLSLLIALRVLLALSFFPYVWQRMVFAGLAACWIWIIYPFAIEQGNRFLNELFAEKIDYLNGGGLLLLEGMGLLALRTWQLKRHFGVLTGWWAKHTQWIAYLLFVPSLWFFAVLYYGEVQLFLSVDQFSFEQLTFGYALLVWAGAGMLPTLFERLLPEVDLRMELDGFLLAIQIILAMVFTALPSLSAVAPSSNGVERPAWQAFLSWLVLLLVGAGIGYMQYKKKNKF